jgi:DNA helicase HerA-like ATPase
VLKVIYKPLSGNKRWHFRTVTRIVIEYSRRTKGLLYGVDEIDQFCNPNEPLEPELNEVVEYGRHRFMSMSCTTRRPHKVSRNLTAQCATMRIFKTNEPRDKKYFEEFIGSAVKELPLLGQYEYLEWEDTGEVSVRGGKV